MACAYPSVPIESLFPIEPVIYGWAVNKNDIVSLVFFMWPGALLKKPTLPFGNVGFNFFFIHIESNRKSLY